MSKEKERIDPCPFCGGESWVEHGLSMWNTYCNNPDCNVKPTAYFESKEEAIAAWGGEDDTGSSSPVAGSYVAAHRAKLTLYLTLYEKDDREGLSDSEAELFYLLSQEPEIQDAIEEKRAAT